MWQVAITLCIFASLGNAQYVQVPVIGWIPQYNIPNNTYNISRFTNNTNNNTNNNGECLAHDYDLPGSHSLFVGCVTRNDTLLYNEVINKASRIFSIREKTIEFPGVLPPGHLNNVYRISGIRAYDLKGNGKGGYVRIHGGGVGQQNVKLYLTTIDWNKSLMFRVQIYGRRP